MANEFVTEIEMTAEDKMSKTVSVLKESMASIRAGRANAKVLDHVLVEYYGTMAPILQVANVSVPPLRLILSVRRYRPRIWALTRIPMEK